MRDIGPFNLAHLIIIIIIIVVTAIAMFMLKGPLSFGFVFPIWMMVIGIVTIFCIIALLVMTITGYLRFGREGFLFAKARKLGTPVYIDVELGSDIGEFVLAEKESPKDVVLKDEESGIKVDPSMLSSEAKPIRFPGGLNLLIYSYYNFMPQSINNHAAFHAIKKYFDTECRELNFLSMKEFTELISDPEHFLERNSLIKLNKYFKVGEKKEVRKDDNGVDTVQTVLVKNLDGKLVPKLTYVRQFQTQTDTGELVWMEQDLDLPAMVQLIAKARQDVSAMPIMGGLIAGTEAFKFNSVAYSSQHLGHVLMLYRTKIMDELKGKVELLQYGIVALMILVGGGIAFYIITSAMGGKGA